MAPVFPCERWIKAATATNPIETAAGKPNSNNGEMHRHKPRRRLLPKSARLEPKLELTATLGPRLLQPRRRPQPRLHA